MNEFSHLCFPSPTSIFVILLARFLDDDDFRSNVFDGVSPFPA